MTNYQEQQILSVLKNTKPNIDFINRFCLRKNIGFKRKYKDYISNVQ